jgi:hypothetical protein
LVSAFAADAASSGWNVEVADVGLPTAGQRGESPNSSPGAGADRTRRSLRSHVQIAAIKNAVTDFNVSPSDLRSILSRARLRSYRTAPAEIRLV